MIDKSVEFGEFFLNYRLATNEDMDSLERGVRTAAFLGDIDTAINLLNTVDPDDQSEIVTDIQRSWQIARTEKRLKPSEKPPITNPDRPHNARND